MNKRPGQPITQADIDAYDEHGVVCLRAMFDDEWVARMRAATTAYLESEVGAHRRRIAQIPGEDAIFTINSFMSVYDSEFLAFRNDSPGAEIAATLMGVDQVRFWYDQMFVKDAGTGAPTQWHHDLPFWPFRGADLVSIWVALTPVTKATSGLEYIAGSHKWGKFYCPVTPDEDAPSPTRTLQCPDFSARHDAPVSSSCPGRGTRRLHLPPPARRPRRRRQRLCAISQRRMAISIRYLGPGTALTWVHRREHVMTLPEWPDLPNGAYPADDTLFPVVWRRPPGV